jgi:AbrB family looped-hinge helix DNA binding protein
MAMRLSCEETIILKIDKLGRIVIPQAVRERLGLQPGASLRLVQQDDDAIYLEPVEDDSKIVYKNGVPVIRGSMNTDIDIVAGIRQDRDERTSYLAGKPK